MIDLLPAQTQRWQIVEFLARDLFRRAGLSEIRTPLLESTDLFSRSIGEGTDVVGKEMYTFLDKSDRSCTLRPEGTASVVRAIIQNGLLSQGPQKTWYQGPMFRYERPQAGRQRQFHQIGVEFFGYQSSLIDSEVIALAWDFLADLGLNGLTLNINSLGTDEDRKLYRNKLCLWLKERADQLDNDSQARLDKNPLRILDTKNPNTQKLLLNAPKLKDSLNASSLKRFEKVQESLNALKIPFIIDENLVRGLDYYCHTAFEITSDDLGSQSTICGGGRYDGLVSQLGGPPTPAIGWAIGMERLIMALGDSLKSPESPDVYMVNKGESAELKALVLTRKLRAENLVILHDSSGASFSKQFKRASKSGASWIFVIGEDEADNEKVQIKRLSPSDNSAKITEKLVDLTNISELKSHLTS